MNWLKKICQCKALPLPFQDTLPDNPRGINGPLSGAMWADRSMRQETADEEEQQYPDMKYLGQGNEGLVYEYNGQVIKYTDNRTEVVAAKKVWNYAQSGNPIACMVPVLEKPVKIQAPSIMERALNSEPNYDPSVRSMWRIVTEKVETFDTEDVLILNELSKVFTEEIEFGDYDDPVRAAELSPMFEQMINCLQANGFRIHDAHGANIGMKDGRMVLIDLGGSL